MYDLHIKNEKEYKALLRALETAHDLADDTSTEPLWPDNNHPTFVLTRGEIQGLKTDIDERVDNLISITRLLERLECLKR
ncbi:MAG: hypothetical protein CTY12_00600 [Methylotenera sp.]|nr:MAG: hypothetical protein CTY12_00600 [Methylotenera sp.]